MRLLLPLCVLKRALAPYQVSRNSPSWVVVVRSMNLGGWVRLRFVLPHRRAAAAAHQPLQPRHPLARQCGGDRAGASRRAGTAGFVTSLPTDNCPQPKETLPAVSTSTLPY